MKKMQLLMLGAFSVLVPLAGQASTIGVDKDSYVLQEEPDRNFGTDPQALIKLDKPNNPNGYYTRNTYLGFNIAGIPHITNATLRLNFIDSGLGSTSSSAEYGFAVYGLADVSDNWNENDITWNNAPNPTGGTFLGSFSLIGKGVGLTQFSSSDLVNFLNDDGNGIASIVLVRTTDASSYDYVHAIATRENTLSGAAEQLEVIPEPAAIGMIVVLSAGLLGVRRFFMM